jgi:hypothetical protein
MSTIVIHQSILGLNVRQMVTKCILNWQLIPKWLGVHRLGEACTTLLALVIHGWHLLE